MTIVLVDAKGRVLSRNKAQKRENPGKVKEKESKKKPLGFINAFNGLNVQLKLLDGTSLVGELTTNAYNKYDLIIATDSGNYLVPKGSVVYIHEAKKE